MPEQNYKLSIAYISQCLSVQAICIQARLFPSKLRLLVQHSSLLCKTKLGILSSSTGKNQKFKKRNALHFCTLPIHRKTRKGLPGSRYQRLFGHRGSQGNQARLGEDQASLATWAERSRYPISQPSSSLSLLSPPPATARPRNVSASMAAGEVLPRVPLRLRARGTCAVPLF